MRSSSGVLRRQRATLWVGAGCLTLVWACGDSSTDPVSSASSSSTQTSSSASGAGGASGQGGGKSGTGGSGGGFSPTTSGAGGGSERCGATLTATVRDFQQNHPDFETFTGSGATVGLVQAMLGGDKKPVFAQSGGQITDAGTFAQWYNDVPNVNQPFQISLQLTESAPGVYSYVNNAFFPIDDQGWGNEGNAHNFHFTTEIHTSFEYLGGEVFTFNGDDDLWMFINGQLALDLGGLHGSIEGSVALDAAAAQLGISVGNVYSMDIFHAERHTDQSNFRVDTTISCFVPPPQ